MKVIYVVLAYKQSIEVEVMGLKRDVTLSWYPGQTGALPLFEVYEDALSYADGNIDKVFKLEVIS